MTHAQNYQPNTHGFSPQARLLPYVEQANLQNLLDFTKPAFRGPFNNLVPNPQFAQAFATPLTLMLCPSDPAPTQTVGSGGALYGGVNYMVSYGSGKDTNYDLRWPTDGICYENSNTRMRDITDGSSNTVAMSESVRSVGPDFVLPAGTLPKFNYQATLNGSSGVSATLLTRQGMTATGGGWVNGPNGVIENPDLATIWPLKTNWRGAASAALRGRGISWAHAGAISSLTNGYNPPNSRIPDVVTHFTGFLGPRSWHTGGAQVLLCDGSVRFVSENIDTLLHRAIHSRNGGEVTGEF
jgi:prepilin-type processing-associated H-X9-DG protein